MVAVFNCDHILDVMKFIKYSIEVTDSTIGGYYLLVFFIFAF